MKYSVANLVANQMNDILQSDKHQSLFNKDYKIANAEAEEVKEDEDDNSASDCTLDHDHSEDPDHQMVADASSYDVAINNLLTASAALDAVGIEKGATLALKLASFVVNAKKVDDKEKADKAKEKAKADKEKAKEKERLAKEKEKAKAAKEKEKEKAAKEKEKAKAKK